MKRCLVVLVSMFLACSVFGQDAPQTKMESKLSFLSIHLAPGVCIHPDTALGSSDDVVIRTGPAVGMSLIGRFPPAPWLIGSFALFGEYHTADFKGSRGSLFGFAWYTQLGVLFDIAPAFSLGALFGPGYGYRSLPDSSDPSDSGSGFSTLGEILAWYRISPTWSLGAEIGFPMMPISYGQRLFLAADVGYHFSAPATPAAQKAAPQPSTPQPSTPQPSTPQPSTPQPSTPQLEQQPQPSDHAFAQEADSTTKIGFETADGQVLRIFEDTTYHGQSSSNPFAEFTLACFAPTIAFVPNGVHKYKIEESSEFLVDARGSSQRWLIAGENKDLAALGNIAILGGVVWGVIILAEMVYELGKAAAEVTVFTVVSAAGGTPETQSDSGSGLLLQSLGASALVVGGLVMVLSSRPRATRIP